ncbi:hypothetical protein KM043_010537 [Ampulex compressa]|nr:hypothetical protein KM043_010537 [Ampulex compressa]
MVDQANISDIRVCLLPEDLEILEDPRTPSLRRISYGIVLPAICCLGIIGNILNLVVLTRRNMRGTAYIYMRGELRLPYLFPHPFSACTLYVQGMPPYRDARRMIFIALRGSSGYNTPQKTSHRSSLCS